MSKNKPIGYVSRKPCSCCRIGLMQIVTGLEIYPHRSDLAELPFWLCRACGAYAGCHAGTTVAKGRVANAHTRELRLAAHAAVDPIWKEGYLKRGEVYTWIQQQLGLTKREAHIGWMSDTDLTHLINHAQKYLFELRSKSFNKLLEQS